MKPLDDPALTLDEALRDRGFGYNTALLPGRCLVFRLDGTGKVRSMTPEEAWAFLRGREAKS